MTVAVKVWMDALATRKQSTRDLYTKKFERFCKWTNKAPDELREQKFQENQKDKPWERSEVENLVRRYLEYLKNEEGLTNLNNHYYAIRSFFSCNGLPLNLNGGDTPTNHGVQGSTVPTREDVNTIVSTCEHIRDRLMILFLKDSGLRTGDLEGLTWGDLKPMGDGFYAFEKITEKRGVLARVFIGPETSKVLELYKRKRLQGTRRRPPEQNIDEHPIFAKMTRGVHAKKGITEDVTPLEARIMTPRLSLLFHLAGVREKGISAHGLRKFWEQNVHAKKESYVKQLNGRALSSTERAYDWLTREQLFEIYKKNYPNLKCLSPQQMIKQEDIERIVEQRVKERMNPIKEEFARLIKKLPENYAKANAEVNADLQQQAEKFEKRISQLEQLKREQIVKVARKLVEELIKSGELEFSQKPKK